MVDSRMQVGATAHARADAMSAAVSTGAGLAAGSLAVATRHALRTPRTMALPRLAGFLVDAGLAMGTAAGALGAVRLYSRAREFPAVSRTPEDQRALDRALDRLDDSPTGAPIAAYLRSQDEADVQVLAPVEYRKILPAGSAGAYIARAGRMIMRRDFVDHPSKGPVILAHEGRHMMNDGLGRYVRITTGLASGAAQGVMDGLRGANPFTTMVDTVHGTLSIDEEVDAYATDAAVAHELGLRVFGLDSQHADGTPKSRAEIEELIRAEPLYQLRGTPRLIMAGGIGVFSTLTGATLVQAAARRLAPGSLPARSRLLNLGLLAAPVAALVAADHKAHR